MNILLTGGNGLIGTKLSEKLRARGHEVRILTRSKDVEFPFYSWGKDYIDENAFKNLDGIIHLAGANISKRWTESYKKEIYDSRILTAKLLHDYSSKLAPNLDFFISASGASYYGQVTSEKIFVEDDLPGNDFLAKISIDWEKSANNFNDLANRVVCIRTSMVLSKNGGAFEMLKKSIQLGMGANVGNGKQWMPWIHIDDLVDIYVDAVENKEIKGNYNAAAPEMINHSTFNKTLAKKMNKPFFLPNMPSFLMKILLGEMSDLVLKGSRLSSEKITLEGFQFKYPTLDKAFAELLNE